MLFNFLTCLGAGPDILFAHVFFFRNGGLSFVYESGLVWGLYLCSDVH